MYPLTGVPLVGLPFAHDSNRVSDTWHNAAGMLSRALATNGSRLTYAAKRYVEVEEENRRRAQQLGNP